LGGGEMLEAIRTCRRLGKTQLKVVRWQMGFMWDPDEDNLWLEYKAARAYIHTHKIIERVLVWLGII